MESDFPPLPKPAARVMVDGPKNNITGGGSRETTGNSPSKQVDYPPGSTQIEVVEPSGDVSLSVPDQKHPGITFLYRVSREKLGATCLYFRNILDPEKFKEGKDIHVEIQKLKLSHPQIERVATEELPRLELRLVSEIAKGVRQQNVVTDFLNLMSGKKSIRNKPSIAHLASIISVADGFTALDELKKILDKYNFPLRVSDVKGLDEESARQRCLVAMCYNNNNNNNSSSRMTDSIVAKITAELVINGSCRWTVTEDEEELSGDGKKWTATWWELPWGVEAELLYRRSTIIATLNDVQKHFLRMYGALPSPEPRKLRCKLGYSNSRACDSFQLGEIIRFLATRIKTISVFSTIDGGDDDDDDDDDDNDDSSNNDIATTGRSTFKSIQDLIEALRTCPEYQIDQHHHHCGMRSPLIKILDSIASRLRDDTIGITMSLWYPTMHHHHHHSSTTTPKHSLSLRQSIQWTEPLPTKQDRNSSNRSDHHILKKDDRHFYSMQREAKLYFCSDRKERTSDESWC